MTMHAALIRPFAVADGQTSPRQPLCEQLELGWVVAQRRHDRPLDPLQAEGAPAARAHAREELGASGGRVELQGAEEKTNR